MGPGTARAGAILFGADGRGGNPSTLFNINPTNGVATPIAAILGGGHGLAISGLAFDSANNTLYGATAPRQNGGGVATELVAIDPKTGAATLVGGLGRSISDLTFDATTGTMFGWSGRTSGNSLVTINLTTGLATQVGNSGITDAGAGLAANSTGTLFLVPGSSNGALDTVNKLLGSVNFVANLTGAPSPGPLFALAFDAHDTLFGVNNGFLVTINTTTGAVTNQGQVLNNGSPVINLDAIAFGPGGQTAAPEPATLTLCGIGAVGLAFGAWRRRQRATL
jgi:hypothetical protein